MQDSKPGKVRAVDPFNFSDKYGVLEDLIDTMDQESQSVKWHNIPITRVHTNYNAGGNDKRTTIQKIDVTRKQDSKRVTWNENLLEIRNISPRVSKEPFKFPNSPSKPVIDYSQPTDHCRHFICKADQPYRLKNNTEPANTIFPPSYTNSFKNGCPSETKLRCSPQLQKVVNQARAMKQLPNHAD